MFVIRAYQVKEKGASFLSLPRLCQLLSVQATKTGEVFAYFVVDSDSKREDVILHSYSDNQIVPEGILGDGFGHLATYSTEWEATEAGPRMMLGTRVVHVFGPLSVKSKAVN